MIVDAHHHLWDPGRRSYPWMSGPRAALRRPFGVADLRAVAEPLGVTATVAVQAAQTEEETLDLLGQAAAADGLVAAVVGWVDLTAPDVAERLSALRGAPGGERLAGVRHPVEEEPGDAWLDGADVRRGLHAMADAGLAYDLLVRRDQLGAAVRLAADVPELRIVLDHGAKPDIAGGGWEPWSSELEALAGLEHVSGKLSGLVTEARWDGWQSAGVGRYAERLLEVFGAGRLMFGSDWPVCTLAASYGEVLEVARSAVALLSASERDAVLGGNAREFYGLDR